MDWPSSLRTFLDCIFFRSFWVVLGGIFGSGERMGAQKASRACLWSRRQGRESAAQGKETGREKENRRSATIKIEKKGRALPSALSPLLASARGLSPPVLRDRRREHRRTMVTSGDGVEEGRLKREEADAFGACRPRLVFFALFGLREQKE